MALSLRVATQPIPETMTVLVETGIERTAAAHVTIGESLVTACWSTVPTACVDWVLGDETSQGPVHQPADQAPIVYRRSCGWLGPGQHWEAVTGRLCGRCSSMVGPWALAEPGHLTGGRLLDLALEVAEFAAWERESQRRELTAHLTADVEDTVRRLAAGDLELRLLPDIATMPGPGVGLDGGEIVAWGCLPDIDGGDDPEVVEVARPIPAGCR